MADSDWLNCFSSLCFIQERNMVRIENILFWFLILLIVGTALWLLHGSPPETDALITIALAVAASELLLWKTLFSMDNKLSQKISNIDKKTALGFANIKNDITNINSKLDTLIRRKK